MRANRGMSFGFTHCACSMRGRQLRHAPRCGASASSARRTAPSPIACRHTLSSARAQRSIMSDQLGLGEARRARPVEHLRRAAAQRAVEERLHAPDAQPLVAPAGPHAHPLRVRQVGERKVVGDAQRQRARARAGAAASRSLARCPSSAPPSARGGPGPPSARAIAASSSASAGAGTMSRHQLHRRLAQDAGRLAHLVAVDRRHRADRRSRGRSPPAAARRSRPTPSARPCAAGRRAARRPPVELGRGRETHGSGHASLYQPAPDTQASCGSRVGPAPTRASASSRLVAAVRSRVSLRSARPFEVDVRIDQAGPARGRAAGRPRRDGLPRPARPSPTARILPSTPAATSGSATLRRETGLDHAGFHRPYVLAMISFMISSVPAPMRARRASRHARSTGNSRM